MRKFAANSPKLEKFTAFAPRPGVETVIRSRSWESLGLVFKSSAGSLKWLKLDTMVLSMFKSMGVPPLENVECLTIGMALANGWRIDLEILEAICAVDLTRCFPRIHSVRVYEVGGPTPRRSAPPLLAIENDEETGDATGISELHAEDCSHSYSVPRLAQMFPHVTKFIASSSADVMYIDLWKFWPGMRTVEITQTVYDLEFNVDAFFCGISIMELTWLKGQGDDFLKNVNIVPTRSGLYSMKG